MVSQTAETRIEQWPVEKLIFYARNPRKNDEDSLDADALHDVSLPRCLMLGDRCAHLSTSMAASSWHRTIRVNLPALCGQYRQ